MSLDTVPKINWESDDGVIFSDMDNIGKNLQALEDSKHEDGDSPTYVTENVTTSNVTTGNITTLNMLGAINPTTSPTASSQAISAGSAWVPARGIYIVSGGQLQINVSGWKNAGSLNIGGAFPADGSNVRIFDSTGSGVTVYYLKF